MVIAVGLESLALFYVVVSEFEKTTNWINSVKCFVFLLITAQIVIYNTCSMLAWT